MPDKQRVHDLIEALAYDADSASVATSAATVRSHDATPILQNLSGGIAVDSWSVLTGMATITTHSLVDDIEIRTLCAP